MRVYISGKMTGDAIKRQDKRCMVKDYEPCGGQLEELKKLIEENLK